jgi:hypothetical protein
MEAQHMFMRFLLGALSIVSLTSGALADDVRDAKVLLCSSLEMALCTSGSGCIDVLPEDMNVPLFLRIDIKQKKLSATEESGEDRETIATALQRVDDNLVIQGYENDRAFSMLVHEPTGYATFTSVTDLESSTIFGACTPLKK